MYHYLKLKPLVASMRRIMIQPLLISAFSLSLTTPAHACGITQQCEFNVDLYVDVDEDGDLDTYRKDWDSHIFELYLNEAPIIQTEPDYRLYQAFELEHPDPEDQQLRYSDHMMPTIGHLDANGLLDWVVGLPDGRLLYYENTDMDNPYRPVLNTTHPINQLQISSETTFYTYPTPVLVDLDADADLDLVVGGYLLSSLHVLENVGNPQQATFVQVPLARNPLAEIVIEGFTYPSFADYDGDGDLDLTISSTRWPQPHFYANIGTITQPHFVQRSSEANPLPHIDLENLASQTVMLDDYDRDGDIDITASETYAYQVTAEFVPGKGPETRTEIEKNFSYRLPNLQFSPPHPHPVQASLAEGRYDTPQTLTLSCNDDCDHIVYALNDAPFRPYTGPLTLEQTTLVKFYAVYPEGQRHGVQAKRYYVQADPYATPYYGASRLYFEDSALPQTHSYLKQYYFSREVELKLSVHTRNGYIYPPPKNGVKQLNPEASMGSLAAVGYLDDDDHLDWVVGLADGRLTYYENTDPNDQFLPVYNPEHPINQLSVADYAAPALVDIDQDGDWDIVVGTGMGTLQTFINQGDAAQFVELTGTANPLAGIEVQRYAVPSFGDVDLDGDYDMVVASLLEPPRYYENTGGTQAIYFAARQESTNPLHTLFITPERPPESYFYHLTRLVDMDSDHDPDVYTSWWDGFPGYRVPALLKQHFKENPMRNYRAVTSNLDTFKAYNTSMPLTFGCTDECQAIYYAIDDAPYQRFTQPITLDTSSDVHFYATYSDGRAGFTQTEHYKIESPLTDSVCRIYVTHYQVGRDISVPTFYGLKGLRYTLAEPIMVEPFEVPMKSLYATFELQPFSNMLYGTSARSDGYLHHISSDTYSEVNKVSLDNTSLQYFPIEGLSFNPATGQLWAWADRKGLYQIHPSTGASEYIFAYDPEAFKAMTWDDKGEFFYLLETVADTPVLWQHSVAQASQQSICATALGDKNIVALEGLSEHRLMYLEDRADSQGQRTLYAGVLFVTPAHPTCALAELGKVTKLPDHAEHIQLTFSAAECSEYF